MSEEYTIESLVKSIGSIITDIIKYVEELGGLPKFLDAVCSGNICYSDVKGDSRFVKIVVVEPENVNLPFSSFHTLEVIGYRSDALLAKLHNHLWEKNKIINIDLLHYDGRNLSLWTEYEFICRICGKTKISGVVEYRTSRDLFEPFDIFIRRIIEEVEKYCCSIRAPTDLVAKIVRKIRELEPIIQVYAEEWDRLVEYALRLKEKEGIDILEYRGEYVDLVYNRHITRLTNGEEIVLKEDKHAFDDSCGTYRRFILEKGDEKHALTALGLLKHYDKI